MATATLTSTPTTIDEATAVTNWGGDTFATNTSAGIDGTCVECIQTTNGNNDVYVTGTWNFTTAVHLRLWFNLTYFENLATSNAIQVFLYDGSNTSYWYWTKGDGYQGGWQQAVIYTGDTPDVDNSVTMSSITRIGMRMVTASKPRNAPFNALYDAWRYGDGFTVTGGTSGDPITWADIATTDAASAYGIVTDNEGVYNLRGAVQIGDGTSTTYFEPSGEVAIFTTEQINTGLYDITFFDDASAVTNIDIAGGVISGPGTAAHRFTIDASATCNAFTVDGIQISRSSTITSHSAASWTNNSFDDCYQIDPSTGTFTNFTIQNYSEAAVNGALLWPGGTTVKDGAFIGCDEAIEITQTADQTFDNLIFTSNTDDVHLNNGGTSISIAKNNGSDPTSQVSTGGGTVTFTGSSTNVLAKVTTEAGVDIENARVYVATTATAAGGLPFESAVTSISSTGTVGTATFTANHKLITGDKVIFQGITDKVADNNRVFTVTYSSDTVVTFTTTDTGSPDTYTGTITSTYVLIKGLTDVNGEIDLDRVFPVAQNIGGWARKSTSPDFFKEGPMSGAISTTADATLSAVLVADD